jgi:hypothetical protein
MLSPENHECLIDATDEVVTFIYGDETVDLTGQIKIFFEEDLMHVSLTNESYEGMHQLQKEAFLEALNVWVKELLREATNGTCKIVRRRDPVKTLVPYGE